MNKTEKIVSGLIVLILIIILAVFIVNKKEVNNLELTDVTKIENQQVQETQGVSSLDQCFDAYCGIEKYLEENLAWTVEPGGVDFCSFDWLNEKDYQSNDPILINTLCQEYYVDDGVLKEASGFSGPVEINNDLTESWQPLTDYDTPEVIERFGSYYQQYLNTQDKDLVEFRENNYLNAKNYFNAEIQYEVTEVLSNDCVVDSDCILPFDYAIKSNCPYVTKCINQECAVICPIY